MQSFHPLKQTTEANKQRLVNFVDLRFTCSVNMSAESRIGHHVLEGLVTVVFPEGGYVLCVGDE